MTISDQQGDFKSWSIYCAMKATKSASSTAMKHAGVVMTLDGCN